MAFLYVILVIDVADTEISLEIDKSNCLWKLTKCQNRIVKLKEIQRDIDEENKMLKEILRHVSKYSKATVEKIYRIRELKYEGKLYRDIAKKLSEATGERYAHSTVRYFYNKYIK